MPIAPIDTRRLFRPLSVELVGLLGTLDDTDWARPTVAGAWRVRDVVAHLADTALRRVSFQRDGWRPPAPDRPIAGERGLAAFINDLNATWTRAAGRLSPRVLRDLYARAAIELCDLVESLDPDSPAFFPVSWAGESKSAMWLDLGREFTEVWHHGSQVRDAVGAGSFSDPSWLHAVLVVAMHALPHAFERTGGGRSRAVTVRITGPAGGTWSLRRVGGAWDIGEGEARDAAASATMTDDTAWRLLFNGLTGPECEARVRLDGDRDAGRALLSARAVIV